MKNNNDLYIKTTKRILDILLAGIGIVITAIPMLACAVAVKMEDGGSVFFKQERVGCDMRKFTCYKIRTMKESAPHETATAKLEEPEKYITGVGALLRKTSFDEIPQLINVIKGDMSIIGPRPVIPCEDELVTLRHDLGVYDIKPGITGLAQINGRDCITLRRKAALDMQYKEQMSFWFDLKLIFGTVINVLTGHGIREGKTPTV